MRTLIFGGTLADPKNRVFSRQNLLLEDGKVAALTQELPEADVRIGAEGKLVAPGFIDLHMHEDDPATPDDKSILCAMLRMGVTTAVGGNCGICATHPADYLDLADRGLPVNLAMLAGHAYFREAAGCTDRYGAASEAQIAEMARAIAAALERGCLGVSYGIRYSPGITREELLATARTCTASQKLIAAHLRDDAEAIFDAAREFLDVAREANVPAQVSHIGSMAGFGQMEAFLRFIDEQCANGLRVSCDCYPYDAFSTSIGATTYDDGWRERYHCGYDAIELCEGRCAGQRCTEETFRAERAAHPEYLTVGHVMHARDIDLALAHPNVMIASDGILSMGQGHPRAAGTFPRVFAEYVRAGKLSVYDAVAKMTAMPAEKLGLADKGHLGRGADADVVVFDPAVIRDTATFENNLSAPEGVDYVLIGGELAVQDGRIVNGRLGRSVRG